MIETLTADSFGPEQIGYFAAGLVIAVGILWRANSSLVTRVLDKQEALLTTLTGEQNRAMGDQNKATAALVESVHRVETAIVKSDAHNTMALGSLKDTVTAAIGRLDKHESRIDTLDGTISEYKTTLNDHSIRFKAHEASISTVTGALPILEHRIKTLESSETLTRR